MSEPHEESYKSEDVEDSEISEKDLSLAVDEESNCNAKERRASFDYQQCQDLKVYHIYHLAKSGVESAVEDWLAERNLEIDSKTLDGNTALGISVDGNDVIAEATLRQCGASDEGTRTPETDLASSSSCNHCVEQVYQASLYRSGASFVRTVCGLLDVTIDSRNGYGESALILAVKAGNCSAVDTLLEAGATVDREVVNISDMLSSEGCFSRLILAKPSLMLEELFRFMIFFTLSVCHLMTVHYYAS